MLEYTDGQLTCQDLSLDDLAREYGTPFFLYDLDQIVERFRRVRAAFAPLEASAGGPGLMVCYACKSNSHRAILELLAAQGAGFDIVSGGELRRLQRAGIPTERAVFAGVGKRLEEIEEAARAGVLAFNVESPQEAERIDAVGRRLGRVLPIALRINPEVDAATHKHITTGKKGNKFGIAFAEAREVIERLERDLPNVKLRGFHAHIGSQIVRDDRHAESLQSVEGFLAELRADGLIDDLEFLNLGGGYGIAYGEDAHELDVARVAERIVPRMKALGLKLLIEPGRFIVGPSGTLVTRVEYIKLGHSKRFVIVDASMCELIRPVLYEAYHRIRPVREAAPGAPMTLADVVGPVCESTDFLALDRPLPPLEQGDLLAILDAGAYCMVMFSTYNSRPRCPEVGVRAGRAHLITPRQEIDDVFDYERPLPA